MSRTTASMRPQRHIGVAYAALAVLEMTKWVQITPFPMIRASPPWPVPGTPAKTGTPMAFVNAIVQAYAQRGLSAEAALARAHIAPPVGTSDGAETPRVSAVQFERLCFAAMQELDDEAPGWFGRRLPWGSYGMLARASQGAPTLGVALTRWCRHHGLLTGDVQLHLTVRGERASVRLTDQLPTAAPREFALLSLLRNVHGLACWWVDSRIPLQAAEFPFAAPPHADVYAALFPGPVVFDAPAAMLSFDARYLALPLRRDGAALDQMLRHALRLMVRPYRRDRLLTLRVRQLLQGDLAHTTESLAAALALSARSLQRHLAAEGLSLQTLKDAQRHARAVELLQRSRRPIKQIAREVGFGNDKSFARAFRAWSETTPDECRRAARAEPQAAVPANAARS